MRTDRWDKENKERREMTVVAAQQRLVHTNPSPCIPFLSQMARTENNRAQKTNYNCDNNKQPTKRQCKEEKEKTQEDHARHKPDHTNRGLNVEVTSRCFMITTMKTIMNCKQERTSGVQNPIMKQQQKYCQEEKPYQLKQRRGKR